MSATNMCKYLTAIATDCNPLQPTATHCNSLQHAATHSPQGLRQEVYIFLLNTAMHCLGQYNVHSLSLQYTVRSLSLQYTV